LGVEEYEKFCEYLRGALTNTNAHDDPAAARRILSDLERMR
jgi:hypothetical protein